MICQIRRIWKYKRGVEFRLKEVYEKYLFEEIRLEKIESLLDVGANIGEFSLCARQAFPNVSVTLIEPEVNELSAARLNLSDARSFCVAIAEDEREAHFVHKNQTGDSHLVFTGEFEKAVSTLKTSSLDQTIGRSEAPTFDLIKIEVEGWEPEVLLGGRITIKNAKYVVIDGSAERLEEGVYRETLSLCIPIMIDLGFELYKVQESVGLFRNKSV